MGSALSRIKRVRDASRLLSDILAQPANVLVVHYSCESFYDRPEGRTPRITSIAIRTFDNGQTQSFSIHKVAEVAGVDAKSIGARYDEFEKSMLTEYFEFVRTHHQHRWIHWNMRDINYGFSAIEHRYRVLGGNPTSLDDSRKIDLSRLLVARFTVMYIGHPRLEKLMDKNRITRLGFLTGEDEAAAFDNSDYVRLHQSTLRKVDVLANILERAADGTLQTDANWREIYGFTPQAIGEFVKEHWAWSLFTAVATIGGIVLGVMAL